VAYTVEFLPTATEELASLPKDDRRKVFAKIEALKQDARPAGVKQLKGSEKFLRLRVGNYRIIYQVDGKNLLVLVVRIGNRQEVYATLDVLARRVTSWRQTRSTTRR
jgi:mRNA interferase RelE/StbE